MKLFLEFQQPQRTTSYMYSYLLVRGLYLSFVSEADEFHTSITLKLVPVSTKIHVSECKFTKFFMRTYPGPFPEKSCLDTLNIVGGKINFFKKVNETKKVKNHWSKRYAVSILQQLPTAEERMVIFTLSNLPGLHAQTHWKIISALINTKKAWKKLKAFHYFMLFIRIEFQTKLTR